MLELEELLKHVDGGVCFLVLKRTETLMVLVQGQQNKIKKKQQWGNLTCVKGGGEVKTSGS